MKKKTTKLILRKRESRKKKEKGELELKSIYIHIKEKGFFFPK